jgi:hypothetical protein
LYTTLLHLSGIVYSQTRRSNMAQRQFKSTDTSKWIDRYGNGSDSAEVVSANSTDAPIDSACTGTIETTSLSATNASFTTGQIILIHQSRGTGAGNWELNKIASYVAGTITTSYDLMNTYGAGAQVLVLNQLPSFTVNESVTLTGKAWNGTVGGIVARLIKGEAVITGTIAVGGANSTSTSTTNVGGGGFRGGKGGATKNAAAGQGEGNVGAGDTISTSANGNGGGGGGGGESASGGAAVGAAALTSLFFGGSGGGSSSDTQVNYQSGAGNAGGNGGGIVLLIGKTITITGAIQASGGNGRNDSDCAGSGGGAGGSVLLKGQRLTLGTTLITASAGTGASAGRGNGGAGGGHASAGSASSSASGGNGAVGRIHADYSTSITGTTTPTIDSTKDNTLANPSGAGLVFF